MNMQHLSGLANMEIDLDSVDGSLLSNNESGPAPMTRSDSGHTLSTVNTSTTFQNPDSHVSASNRRIEAAALRGGGETARGSGDSLDDATADSSVVATPIPTPKKNKKTKKPADCPRISFHDSAQNLATGSTWNLTKAIPVDEKDDDDSDVDEEKDVLLTSKFAYKPGKKSGSVRAAGLKSSIKQPRYSDRSLAKKDDKPKSSVRPAKVVPSVRRNSNPQREVRDAPTAQSVMRWDLNGKGRLDEIEMAMRERDVDGDGTLSKREVKSIIEDQLRDQSEYRLYCKMACYLMGLVLLLAVSNLGTSLAAVVLAKDTALDPATGTVQQKGSNEVTGMQATAYHLELAELSDEEFEERRLLVDAEMAEDPDHPDHHHRRLGQRSRPTKVNTCGCTKVAYDSGKITERSLHDIANRCDGVQTVNMSRRWRGDEVRSDVDTLCGPGTKVVRRGSTRKVKTQTKVKNCRKCANTQTSVVVEEQVTFKQSNGKAVSFNCGKGGSCYGSGETLLQGEGHPCTLERDFSGASECEDGLVCYDVNDPRATRGTGECTRLSVRAAAFGMCNVDFGVDACESGYTCQAESRGAVSANGRTKVASRRQSVSVVRTGTCMQIRTRAFALDTCDASLGRNACDSGYYCLGSNGVDLGGRGYGVCTAIAMKVRSGAVCDMGYGADSCGRGYYCGSSGFGRRMEVVGHDGHDRKLVEVAFTPVEHAPPVEAISAPAEATPTGEEARDLQQYNQGGQCSINQPCSGNDAGMCCSQHGFCNTGWDYCGPGCQQGPCTSGYLGPSPGLNTRSGGFGICARSVAVGGKCFSNESCGWNYNQNIAYQCFGLSTSAGTVGGGYSRSNSGYCG